MCENGAGVENDSMILLFVPYHGQPGSYQIAGRVSTDALLCSDVANLMVLSKPEVVQQRRCQGRTSIALTEWRRVKN
jgi:hypothetical protein